jgi:hypothetical protein
MRIINAPLRSSVDPYDFHKIDCDMICIGGTLSEDADFYATSEQLEALADIGIKVMYSINPNRTPIDEFNEYIRYKAKGVNVTVIRGFNEAGNDPNLTQVSSKGNAAYEKGFADNEDYLTKLDTYLSHFEGLGLEIVYSGLYPYKEMGNKFLSYRKGWNAHLNTSIPLDAGIDFHIYDRCKGDPIDLDQLPSMNGRRRWLVELGSLINGSLSIAKFRQEYVLSGMKSRILPNDVLGVQVAQNKQYNGLIDMDGNLTDWGLFYNSLVAKKIVAIIAKTKWIISPYRWYIFKLSDGSEIGWGGFYWDLPSVGDDWY